MMQTLSTATLCVTAMFCWASTAQAATQSFSGLFSGIDGDNNIPVVLNQFDSSLGTLTGVEIEYVVNKTGGTVGLDNDTASAVDVT